MNELKLEPHLGIGPIRFGESREAVRATLAIAGLPFENSRRASDYFRDAAIQVEFDPFGRVHFIGVACHPSFTLTYHGSDVFDTPAQELFQLIATQDDSGPHQFTKAEYLFPKQIITLWEADEQYDRRGAGRPIWGQVGLGNQFYLEAIQALE
jgi:hypothetical protein